MSIIDLKICKKYQFSQIGSARELTDALTKISNALSSPSDDWEEHVAAVRVHHIYFCLLCICILDNVYISFAMKTCV